jgi:hypothetical protein
MGGKFVRKQSGVVSREIPRSREKSYVRRLPASRLPLAPGVARRPAAPAGAERPAPADQAAGRARLPQETSVDVGRDRRPRLCQTGDAAPSPRFWPCAPPCLRRIFPRISRMDADRFRTPALIGATRGNAFLDQGGGRDPALHFFPRTSAPAQEQKSNPGQPGAHRDKPVAVLDVEALAVDPAGVARDRQRPGAAEIDAARVIHQ